MSRLFTPSRRRGFEHLDNPDTTPALRERSLRDVRLANTVLGGANAVLSEVRRILPALGESTTLLDVGTGLADIPLKARTLATRADVRLFTIGLDEAASLAALSGALLNARSDRKAFGPLLLSTLHAAAPNNVVVAASVRKRDRAMGDL